MSDDAETPSRARRVVQDLHGETLCILSGSLEALQRAEARLKEDGYTLTEDEALAADADPPILVIGEDLRTATKLNGAAGSMARHMRTLSTNMRMRSLAEHDARMAKHERSSGHHKGSTTDWSNAPLPEPEILLSPLAAADLGLPGPPRADRASRRGSGSKGKGGRGAGRKRSKKGRR